MHSGSGQQSLHEEIVAFLREKQDGVSSRELAEKFLKMKDPVETLAHTTIRAILGADSRCRVRDGGVWECVAEPVAAADSMPLTEMSWAAVYIISAHGHTGSPLTYIGVWSVANTPQMLGSYWIGALDELAANERDVLVSPCDQTYDRARMAKACESIAGILGRRTCVFMSSAQQGLLFRMLMQSGEPVLDDTELVSSLARSANISLRRPLSLSRCYEDIVGKSPTLTSGLRQAECFAECLEALISRLCDRGVTTRAELDNRETSGAAVDWGAKGFSLDDIRGQPRGPGVYGFKARDGSFLYIGKAGNLRRRLMSYWRDSDESPAKLERLRQEAYGLVVHPCGSELESLMYEYRLIRKYKPRLNTQADIQERKGAYAPVADCIVLLPHVSSDAGMSVWFRRDQKVVLRAFSLDAQNSADIARELEQFFYVEKLPVSPSDYPEQEIVSRYIQKNRDRLMLIPVDRFANGEEMWEGVMSYWAESQTGS